MTTLEALAAIALILIARVGQAIQLLHMLNGTVLVHTGNIGRLERWLAFVLGHLGIKENEIE